jgi:ABC-2 type transport system permease protein
VTTATPSIIGGTWTIVRARWQVARNSFWRGKLVRKLSTLLIAVVILTLSYGLYRFSRFMVHGLLHIEQVAPELSEQFGSFDRFFAAVPSIVLTIFAFPLLLSSVSFALSTLYLSRDLDTLLVTPVPVRSVFLARFLEGLLTTYLLFFALLAPALAGYGQALGYGAGFYLALFVVLALLPLLPVSVGALLTMLLVRFIPAKRLRDVLTIIGGLFGLVIYIGSQLLTQAVDEIATPENAERLLQFDIPTLPTSWGARVLVAAGTGDLRTLAIFGSLYLLATLGLFSVCVVLAEQLYYRGWISMAGTGGGRVRRRAQRTLSERAGRRAGSRFGTIVRKDLRIFPRDLQQVSQLLFPLAISVFWLWRVITDTQFSDTPIGSDRLADSSLVAMGLFVCILIASHIGMSGLSREGNAIWLLKLAPVDAWTILWAKWTLAWLPFPLIGTAFVGLLGVLKHQSGAQLAQDWLLVLLTGVGVAGITTGFGAAFPKFDWQQPRKMTSTRAGCLATPLYFVYAGVMLVLTTGAGFAAEAWGGWAYIVGWGLAVVITGFAVWLPLLFGVTRLRNSEL